jgi:putative DNA primase/helicase
VILPVRGTEDKRGSPNGRGPDLDAYLVESVYPALYARLDAAFPEFNFVKRGDAWVATSWPANFPYHVEHRHPDRLMAYADRPWWCKVHGHSGVRWLDYVNGGRRPRGQEFLDAVRRLCELAGVEFPTRTTTPEQAEAARKRDERRAVLDEVNNYLVAVLWSEAGAEARRYLREDRGLAEDEVRNLGLGYFDSARALWRHLKAKGFSYEACKEAGVLRQRMQGYISIPWQDEYGRPLTVYGRWHEKVPPLMKYVPAWGPERRRLYSLWEENDAGKKPWGEPSLPKFNALPGRDSKASPLFFDRVRREGHRAGVLFEGVFDALYAHVRGETRAMASVAAQLNGNQLRTLERSRVELIYVCGDPDGGGDQGTRDNVEASSGTGSTAKVGRPCCSCVRRS